MQQFLISALCLCLCLAASPAAGEALHVGLTDDYPPLSYIDREGQRRGFEYDLAGYAFLLTDQGQEFDRLDVPFDAETKVTGSRVAVRTDRRDLLDAVNRALKALLYSGELHNRSRNYFQYIIY